VVSIPDRGRGSATVYVCRAGWPFCLYTTQCGGFAVVNLGMGFGSVVKQRRVGA